MALTNEQKKTAELFRVLNKMTMDDVASTEMAADKIARLLGEGAVPDMPYDPVMRVNGIEAGARPVDVMDRKIMDYGQRTADLTGDAITPAIERVDKLLFEMFGALGGKFPEVRASMPEASAEAAVKEPSYPAPPGKYQEIRERGRLSPADRRRTGGVRSGDDEVVR
jgi:hypothetical protein